MGENFGESIWESAWIMFTGPDIGDVRDVGACFKFDTFIHISVYLLFASFCLMIIIVLVNLLIAMMSKTFERVCDDHVREIEWSFHMMNLKTKFIRRDFVAPVPMNLLPHFYKHLYSDNAFWRKFGNNKRELNRADSRNRSELASNPDTLARYNRSLATNFIIELDQSEIQQRNDAYEDICDRLVQRYRRKYL